MKIQTTQKGYLFIYISKLMKLQLNLKKGDELIPVRFEDDCVLLKVIKKEE